MAIRMEGKQCYWGTYILVSFLLGYYVLAAMLRRRSKLLRTKCLHTDVSASGIWKLPSHIQEKYLYPNFY